jgi:hypothetical protein
VNFRQFSGWLARILTFFTIKSFFSGQKVPK